jgi:hypothetical protein
MDVNQENTRNKPGPKRGRPNEIKISVGLRAYFSDQEKLIKKHGSMQKFFDKVVSEEVAIIDAESAGNSQD